MAIIVKNTGGGSFEPAPEGVHMAVCCDVVDLGEIETKFGKKHKIDVVWQVDEKMKDGRPYLVQQRYTASLNEKANLRHDLEAWRGKKFTEEELAGFDLEKLIGVPCQLLVVHNEANERVYANVKSIMAAPKGSTMDLDPSYTRRKDRQVLDAPSPQSEEPPAPDDDDIPF